ncbi:claudin-9-like [Salvelinus alpinus]|uniref:claudin-9-like n=1 Tax=Salvelinus alpinus TaxID=8036 RepID=UPI0039FCFAE5
MGMDIMDIVFIVEMVEVVGIALGVIGLILTIVICALPTWIVTTIIADNSANTEVVLYGLWMSCVTQGTGKTQCGVYNSREYWEYDLQRARAMTLTAIILVVLGVMVSMVGAKSTNCIKDKTSQAKLIIIAGILFILAGILIIIPVSLLARSIISDSSTRIKGKTELGASLYFGWVAAALLLIGGVILCITVGVFGWMMGIFGWIVSLVACVLSILYYPPPINWGMWKVLMTITSISSILAALGVMGSIFGTKCCNCIKSNRIRVKARFIVGIFFILAGILQLTTEIVVVHYLITDVQRQIDNFAKFTVFNLVLLAEVSSWSACMLLIGGTILCCCIFKRNQPDSTTTQSTSR